MPSVRTEHRDQQDERAEVILEPGQTVDLLPHWRAIHLEKRVNGDKPRYMLVGQGALGISLIQTTNPDSYIEFMSDYEYRPSIIGGPWVTRGQDTRWVVPVGRAFSLVVTNRSKETYREKVYMRAVIV